MKFWVDLLYTAPFKTFNRFYSLDPGYDWDYVNINML